MRRLLRCLFVSAGLIALLAISALCQATPRQPGELAWAIHYDPATFDPAKVDEQASALVRYLTGGVLLRLNRQTQEPEPQLAESFQVSAEGTSIVFKLRSGLRFSDGAPLTSADVAWSLRRVLAPSTQAVVAEEFLLPSEVTIDTPNKLTVTVHLPKRIIGVDKIFDEIAIEPANRPSEGRVSSGPFTVTEYKRGQYVRLSRNPYYWLRDGAGVQLPYATSVRLDVLNNREQEISLFLRGEYDLIDGLSSDYFGILAQKAPGSVHDLGASLNTEQLWFNQSSSAPLPDFEKAWFQNQGFRVAVSEAIHRADLARIAYNGHATPAFGFISPANKFWHNAGLKYPHESVSDAEKMLAASGFHRSGNQLYDSEAAGNTGQAGNGLEAQNGRNSASHGGTMRLRCPARLPGLTFRSRGPARRAENNSDAKPDLRPLLLVPVMVLDELLECGRALIVRRYGVEADQVFADIAQVFHLILLCGELVGRKLLEGGHVLSG